MTDEQGARQVELDRVLRTYPPMGRATIVTIVLLTLFLVVASLFRDVSVSLWVGMVVGAVLWEVTKLRLRRNARRYASSGDA